MWGATPELLLFPFFLFSLLAVGMARNRSSAHRDFLSGYRGIGMIVSFTVVVLAFGAGLVLLFLPYLSAAAEMGYGLLKSAAAPLGPIIVAIIKFLFTHDRIRQAPAFSTPGGAEGPSRLPMENSWWVEIVGKILGWGFLGLGVVIAAILCVLTLWFLFRWLFSATKKSEETRVQWNLMLLWLTDIWSAFFLCWNKIVSMARGCRDAVDLYRGLLTWGRHSGMPHSHCETPREYGLRLSHRFPELGREIQAIAEAFNREVYGEMVLDAQQFTTARAARNRLRSPIYWPSRFKSLFLGMGNRPLKCESFFDFSDS